MSDYRTFPPTNTTTMGTGSLILNTTTVPGLDKEGVLTYTPGSPVASAPAELPTLTMQVYINNGVVFEYEVKGAHKAREHASAIVATGYRHNDGVGEFEHYPPHRIDKVKVKVKGVIPTNYPDRVSGT